MSRLSRFLAAVATTLVAAATTAAVAVPAAAEPVARSCDPGRLAVTYTAGGSATTSEKAYSVCRYDTGALGMEPSFDFLPDGRIVYQSWGPRSGAIGGLPAPSAVVRSDAGHTAWMPITPGGSLAHPHSLDPYLHIDHRTGRIFTLDWDGAVFPLCATMWFSDNGGDAWTPSPLGCAGFDGESIGTGPPVHSPTVGYADLVYYCTSTVLGSGPPTSTPICNKSLDGGHTFIPTLATPFPLYGAQDTFASWGGDPAVADDGSVYLPKRYGGQPEIAISRDEGDTWTDVAVAANGSAGEANRVAIDRAGTLFYTWAGGDHKPYIATSRDRGLHWGKPIPLAPPGLRESAFPRIAVGDGGRVAAVYLGSTNAPGVPPWYTNCNVFLGECTDGAYVGATWNGYITLVDDAFAAASLEHTITVNPPSRPLFTGGCSAEAACKGVLDFLDVRFDRAGHAWGAFVDDCQVTRDFTPVFNASAGPCEDGAGEAILGELVPTAAPPPAPSRSLPETSAPGVPLLALVLSLAAAMARPRRRA